jgi:uridine kinase
LAAAIAGRVNADIVHTDDFASWDVPLEWWPRLRDQVLIPLSGDQPARYQRYDWDRKALAEWIEVSPGGLVLIEGVSSSRSAFRPYLAGSIWVDAPRATRLRRGLERDGAEAREQWLHWMAEEDAWAAEEAPAEHADCIVAGGE